MDTLTLSGLQYHAPHGYYKEEQEQGNDFEIDLEFYADLTEAGTNDDLNLTIDYQHAEQIVHGVMEGPSVKLIETLIIQMGDRLFDHFSIAQQLVIRLRKMHPPIGTHSAYAQITRTWKR